MISYIPKLYNSFTTKFSVFFYYTGRPNLINPIFHIRKRFEKKAFEKIKESYPDLFKIINHMREKSKSRGCEYGDYLQLYEDIKNLKSNYILECGSGISSAVIALAIKENKVQGNKESVFVSMEEDIFFYEQLKKIFPKDLKEHVNFVYSKQVISNYGQYIGRHYENIPKYPYDYIYIDGPSFKRKKGEKKGFNSDLVEIMQGKYKISKINGLIDQRIGTVWTLRKIFGKSSFKYSVSSQTTKITGLTNK